MREIFDDLFANQPLDPVEAARRHVRHNLRKRFYQSAAVGAKTGTGHPIALDGKPVRTPARNALVAPTTLLAQAIADEWSAQGEVVDPANMPLTRLANTVIDGISGARDEVVADVRKYLGSDLVCYRADWPEGLVALQTAQWDPVIDWARDELGARFVLTTGVTHVAQSEDAIAAAARAIPEDPWRLGAVSSITTLTGSALMTLALARNAMTADAVWGAAHVDEDWNAQAWGHDEFATRRRAYRHAEMIAAAMVLAHTR